MARPLRIEYPGAMYHIISRGDHRELIFLNKLKDSILGDENFNSEIQSKVKGKKDQIISNKKNLIEKEICRKFFKPTK